MNQDILKNLQGITPEEQAILDGRTTIDREIYMQGQDSVINAAKLLAAGKLITLRPSTRFIDFPEHTHDYVEVVYMCQGSTRHVINGNDVILNAGELLFISQSFLVCQLHTQREYSRYRILHGIPTTTFRVHT